MNVVLDCGVSADDLVAETLEKFFESPNGLGWRESKGSLHAFLGKVLRNKLIDHLRRDKKVAPRTPESNTPPRAKQGGPALLDEIALAEFKDKLLHLIRGREDERELEEFILASSMTTGEGKVNQQLADLLGVDEGEVINRRRRIWRVAGVQDLYQEFQNGRKENRSSN